MGDHQIVMLHGQPGLGSDWEQLAGLLSSGLAVTAVDRPGYGASPQAAGGFAANARAVVAELDARNIDRAVLVGHSHGGGVALSVATQAPERVEALVLLASIGPGCLNGWDRLLSAPVTGEVCAVVAWRLTPWLARAGLTALSRRRGHPPAASEHVNWHIWATAHFNHGSLWRTFLTEQRSLTSELADLTASLPHVKQPVLLLADPEDTLVPVTTAYQLAAALPDARIELVHGTGHHLPRRGAPQTAERIIQFLADLDAIRAPG